MQHSIIPYSSLTMIERNSSRCPLKFSVRCDSPAKKEDATSNKIQQAHPLPSEEGAIRGLIGGRRDPAH